MWSIIVGHFCKYTLKGWRSKTLASVDHSEPEEVWANIDWVQQARIDSDSLDQIYHIIRNFLVPFSQGSCCSCLLFLSSKACWISSQELRHFSTTISSSSGFRLWALFGFYGHQMPMDVHNVPWWGHFHRLLAVLAGALAVDLHPRPSHNVQRIRPFRAGYLS